jgi:hypothetical protein
MLDSLCHKFSIKYKLSTVYHSQPNGLVECFNWIICETLAKFANKNKNNWDLYMSSVLFAYRTRRHSTTRHEPFYFMYGRNAILPIEFSITTPHAELSETNLQGDLMKRIHMITEKVIDDGLIAQDIIHKAETST